MMRLRITLALAILASCGRADTGTIQKFYDSLLDGSSGTPAQTERTFHAVVSDEAIREMSNEDIRPMLATADKCLHSPVIAVQRYGLLLFALAEMRPNNEALIRPYLRDMETISSDANNPLEGEAYHVLVAINPKLPPEVVTYLKSRLAETLSPMEAAPIVAALLESARWDESMIGEVLSYVKGQSDVSVTDVALQKLGQIRTRDNQALSFIQTSLKSPNVFTRTAALQAVGDLEPSTRANFLTTVTRMATDPTQPEEIRSLAESVLNR